MTLIVAFKCSDGIAVGADSAATLVGLMGQETVREIATKLCVVKDSLILGLSGPVGLAQRYHGELESKPARYFEDLSRMGGLRASTLISSLFWEHAKVEYERAGIVAQATRTTAPLVHAQHQTVVALRTGGRDCLFQFSQTCAPEEATDDLPYISIGIGQQNADPFLAFVRRLFWPGRVPNLSGGIFATVWTLDETIKSAPGQVSYPVVMATLQEGKARFLEPAEIDEHLQAIEEARGTLQAFGKRLEGEE